MIQSHSEGSGPERWYTTTSLQLLPRSGRGVGIGSLIRWPNYHLWRWPLLLYIRPLHKIHTHGH